MNESDYTLSSPLLATSGLARPLLALTVVWHIDQSRIGEQHIGGIGIQTLQVSRFQPSFSRPLGDSLPLGHRSISRDPVIIERDDEDAIRITPASSRMVVELNGVEIGAATTLSYAQVESGAILGLGRSILVCIHWMRCLPKENTILGMQGVGEAAIRARERIAQVAASDLPVLLLGETGTGKEVAAQAIHAMSKRSAASLVSVNMAALNESLAAGELFGAAKGAYTGAIATRQGLFAQAEGGTLFLDEIGNTPTSVQPLLLRVLESGEYRPLGAHVDRRANVRLIAATDQNVYSPAFNQPLLRRLEGFLIQLPPLRARREDIGVLIVHLTDQRVLAGGAPIGLPIAFIGACANYDWPGNIRQLAHVLKRAMLALTHGETPVFDELVDPPGATAPGSAATAVASPGAPTRRRRPLVLSENDTIDALETNGWYIQAAAQQLGISRPSMYKLIEANPQIRRADQIAPDEVRQAFHASGGTLERCASLLKTPSEALRRRLSLLDLVPRSQP
ncbi:MAG: sigma 54-interacting transcriptional regulator [Pseudomonadota bacterium]